MFEKEAEEYTKENLCKECHNHCREGMCTCTECKKKTFKDGAEFGYNKANEWHYISKEGFPKDEKAYFVIINYGALGNECGVMENLNKDKPKNVIAWKEIVPPELKESKQND